MIRDAEPADAEGICAIYNPYVAATVITFEDVPVSVDDMRARVRETRVVYPWLVYAAGGEILAYAYATRWRTRAAYDRTAETTIYVKETATGSGIGARLYDALLARLREAKLHAAIGCIALPNPASVALHEKCGFVKVGHCPEVGRKFGRWVDVGFWQIRL